jgi:oligopeptidase B
MLGPDRTDAPQPPVSSEPPDAAQPPRPPIAPRRPTRLEAHGDVRVDDWYWLGDRDDPEVLAHLRAENAYAEAITAPSAGLRDRLYEEIRARVQEDDVSAPARNGGWWYWSRTEAGRQYRIHCRLADPDRTLDAEAALAAASASRGDIILDENAEAEGRAFHGLGVFDVSPDQRLLAHASDHDGSERYALRFRDLASGADLPDEIDDVSYGSAWSADGSTFFYTRHDAAMRPFEVWRHRLGTAANDDVRVYHEPDERFFVSVRLTRSRRYVLIESESRQTAEVHFIAAEAPELEATVIAPRVQGVEYEVDHVVVAAGDAWLVRTNAPSLDGDDGRCGPCPNFEVRLLSVDGATASTLVRHRDDVTVVAAEAFAEHAVVFERADGLERIRIVALDGHQPHVLAQPEPVYALTPAINAEFDAELVRFGYTSLISPRSTVEYGFDTHARTVVKTQPVLGGYDPSAYRTERLWATAADGTAVPISLVARADVALDGTAACLLYGYGAYEVTVDSAFSASRVNLLERGFVYAIAHVRGGGEMGRRWYEQGRLEHKRTTFTDFIACAEHLIATGWTAPDRLVVRGGSAGGLLMGAVTNMRPDLWAGVVAEVPFVDVVTTMSDERLPLTVTEWEEWGDPVHDARAYETMRSYSPYDNVAPLAYPTMYVTAGLNDPRVGYWEPAKWVCKLRATRTGDGPPVLLRTELGAGHLGPSGRYEAWRDEARVQAFVLGAAGVGDA